MADIPIDRFALTGTLVTKVYHGDRKFNHGVRKVYYGHGRSVIPDPFSLGFTHMKTQFLWMQVLGTNFIQ